MRFELLKIGLLASASIFLVSGATWAQAPQATSEEPQLPSVDVIQQQPTPAPQAAEPKAAPKKKTAPKQAAPKQAPTKQATAKQTTPKQQPPPVQVVSPDPVPPSEDLFPQELGPVVENPIYGAAASGGAAARAEISAQTPINPRSILPRSLEEFSSAATHISLEQLTEQQPRTTNEIFTRVPGAIVVNDDGLAHHGGIGIRGAPPRRSRKILVMEDGQSVNLALWLDPSVHYFAPEDRIESVEVIRGTVITHGPNNNFGVINIRNLSPFGPDETVISGAIGWIKNNGADLYGLSNKRHVHTRQSFDNVGVVASYSGADADGAWDTERLRHNDFYGAIGWKGVDQDLVVSMVHARQRDNYDESNLELEEDDSSPGEPEAAFFGFGHCKTCFAPGAIFNTYAGDITRAQITHNYYVDDDTTITSRLYASRHRRDRYQIVTLEDDPSDADDPGLAPAFGIDGPGGSEEDAVYIPEDSMFGRLRTFRSIGSEVRAEFANRPFFAGLSQDIQTGIRYEYQDFKNRNFLGLSGQVLEDGDEEGLTIFERNLRANTVSAFLQTSINAAPDLKVVPGVRFEYYHINRDSFVVAEEEGEAEEAETPADEAACEEAIGEDECLILEGIHRDRFSEDYQRFHVLPGIAFSYTGLYRSTIYGGYHRGLSTAVLRNETFPAPDEIGNNFQLGIRSTALRGLTFDVAAFHHRLEDFQIKQAFSATGADKVYNRADEVHINGVEMYGRLDSQPFTGGHLNFFAEANYTYARSIIHKGTIDDDGTIIDVSGNRVPEVPMHVAALTLGVENRAGWHWDASATYTYRGNFYTDELNSPYGSDPEGEVGEVPDVWILSARANLRIGDTGASIFIAGDNLLDKLYITDREDGLKPGMGRTIWTGFKYKF